MFRSKDFFDGEFGGLATDLLPLAVIRNLISHSEKITEKDDK
jgi:hypothetical protein